MKSATTRHFRLLLVALLLVLVASIGAKCVIDVQCGDVLAFDHAHYKLNGDLICPFNASRSAVTITFEGGHFNLAGNQLVAELLLPALEALLE